MTGWPNCPAFEVDYDDDTGALVKFRNVWKTCHLRPDLVKLGKVFVEPFRYRNSLLFLVCVMR
jgi:hypothetical protein